MGSHLAGAFMFDGVLYISHYLLLETGKYWFVMHASILCVVLCLDADERHRHLATTIPSRQGTSAHSMHGIAVLTAMCGDNPQLRDTHLYCMSLYGCRSHCWSVLSRTRRNQWSDSLRWKK